MPCGSISNCQGSAESNGSVCEEKEEHHLEMAQNPYSQLVPTQINDEEQLKFLKELTSQQLKVLLEAVEEQLKECEPSMEVLRKRVGYLKRMNIPERNENFKTTRLALLDTEAYHWQLLHRRAQIKHALLACRPDPEYIPSPINRHPKVLVCNPWKSKMPVIVITKKPQDPMKEMELSSEFLKCLTQEEFDNIKNDHLWAAFNCNNLQIQIAGLHHNRQPLLVKCTENGDERILFDTRVPQKTGTYNNLPCKDKDGLLGQAGPCKAFQNKVVEVKPATIMISIDTKDLRITNEPLPLEEEIPRYLLEKVDEIIRRAKEEAVKRGGNFDVCCA